MTLKGKLQSFETNELSYGVWLTEQFITLGFINSEVLTLTRVPTYYRLDLKRHGTENHIVCGERTSCNTIHLASLDRPFDLLTPLSENGMTPPLVTMTRGHLLLRYYDLMVILP